MANLFPIDRYLNIRAATGPSFAPDGRTVSFLTNITGVAQLWQVPAAAGWPTQLTFTHESVRGAWYHPRRHELVYAMDTGGDERTQLFLLAGVGGGTDHGLGNGWTWRALTAQPKAIHSFGGFSRDGQRIAFAANRTDPSRFDIYVQDLPPSDGRQPGKHSAPLADARRVHQGPGGYFLPVGWSADDRSLLVYRPESNFNQDLYVIDVAGDQARLLTPHKGNVQYESPTWSADGKRVYCSTTAQGRDLAALAQIDAASGELTFLDTPPHEVELVVASPRGRWLAYTLNVGGKSEIRLRDLKSGKTSSAPGLPLGVVSQLVFSEDDAQLAFGFDGPRYNPDIWIWDLHANKLRQLTHSSRAGIPFDDFVEPELIEYKTFDGRMIPAWFWRPRPPGEGEKSPGGKSGDLPPVIVYPHGGPESQTRPNFTALFQYFVARGYAVLAPNVRGSTGYGVAYMNLDNTTKRMDAVADLAHAAYWLRDHKQGDPKRLAVYGGSYGGFMVLAQVTHYPDLWAAGIDVVGICNFVTFMEKTGAYRRAHREAEYGNLREHRDFLEKISPIHHVGQIKLPVR
jgi:dipeptidyl aminopeptidase/acylaminoacyl peptidase